MYNRNYFTGLCASQFIVRHSLLRRDVFLNSSHYRDMYHQNGQFARKEIQSVSISEKRKTGGKKTFVYSLGKKTAFLPKYSFWPNATFSQHGVRTVCIYKSITISALFIQMTFR